MDVYSFEGEQDAATVVSGERQRAVQVVVVRRAALGVQDAPGASDRVCLPAVARHVFCSATKHSREKCKAYRYRETEVTYTSTTKWRHANI